MSLIGASVVRKEDPNLLRGKGRFTGDFHPWGTVYAKLVLSEMPHAWLRTVNLSAALQLPGVLKIYTIHDFKDYPDLPGPDDMQRPVLARNKVVFVGEPVAVVVAETQAIAEDAAALVEVEYDPLPAMTTIEAALAPEATPILAGQENNITQQAPALNDLERELQKPRFRESLRLTNNRCSPSALETMSCLVDWNGDQMLFYASTQAPHHLRNTLAKWLALPQHQLRVIAPEVGGGFGSKIVWYPELFIMPLIAKWLGRPVKSVLSRSEAMLAMSHGRDQVHELDFAFDEKGKLHALRMVVTQNLGAWPDPTGLALATLTTWMAGGCYKIPHISTAFRNVLTNTTPVAAYRGAGRPEASYSIERVMDVIADVTGIDPTEVRFRNFIARKEFPYQQKTHDAVIYDSGDFSKCLEKLIKVMDYPELLDQQQEQNSDPEKPLMGIGFSTWLEIAGFGPNGSLESFGHLASWESAHVRVQPDGSVILSVGTSPHGQGHQTIFSQIAAELLGMDFDQILVRHGDTETVQQGVGTFGSRAVPTAGEAVKNACLQVNEKAKLIAAHLLECHPNDVINIEGGFQVKGVPGARVDWSDVAMSSYQPLALPENFKIGSLEAKHYQEVPGFSYPSGAYACVVLIDRETGKVKVRDFFAVDDCGVVINPLLAEGQVQGGVAQGISQALYEHFVYSQDGYPMTPSFFTYAIPTTMDLPSYTMDRICTPTPNNTLGAKGIGESGSVGSPPSVVNAVVDALHFKGVRHIDMPLTPEKIWRILNDLPPQSQP